MKVYFNHRLVIYPRDCAMHGAVQVRVPHFGYVTFTPNYWGKRNWSLIVSHNATPWAATLAVGPGVDQRDKLASRARRAIFGFGRKSLAWCQGLNDAVEMADHVSRWYPDDMPVNERELERLRAEAAKDPDE